MRVWSQERIFSRAKHDTCTPDNNNNNNNSNGDKVNNGQTRESGRQPRIIKTSEEIQHNSNNNEIHNSKVQLSLSERRRKIIKKLIQERARACLFHGVCI